MALPGRRNVLGNSECIMEGVPLKTIRKAPGALDPAVVLLPLKMQNILRSFKIRAQVV